MNNRKSALGVVVPAFLIVCVGPFVLEIQAQGPGAKPNVVAAPYSTPADGPAMYRDYCAACHGSTGKGDGPAAAALKARPTDLTRLTANNQGTFPTMRFQDVLERGAVTAHGSSEMPIWGSRIFEAMNDRAATLLRIRILSAYVEQLQAK